MATRQWQWSTDDDDRTASDNEASGDATADHTSTHPDDTTGGAAISYHDHLGDAHDAPEPEWLKHIIPRTNFSEPTWQPIIDGATGDTSSEPVMDADELKGWRKLAEPFTEQGDPKPLVVKIERSKFKQLLDLIPQEES